ncbi:phage portal protein [Carnobacterium antarcticum]|uniref:Phage portal protein n=1 Tax=Carnobacterium antarcticum TaxID=2126436 RepID=A0ABW4NNJ9_9LACT|nr:phage portal protein [Carnobacterium sp. CP1]ALV20744.1 Phage portal protein [Carnobacterium sp. CP1]
MAIAIDRELAGDIDNPSTDVLKYCIDQHQKELERLQKLSDYYDGKHDVLERTLDNENAKNSKVMVNNAKYVTDMNVGFLVGNPISYSSGKDKNIDPVLEVYEEMDVVSHDTELEKDLSVFGVGLELLYLRKVPGKENETEIRIKVIDPRGVFLVTDDTIEKNSLFAVHYYEKFDLAGKSTGWLLNIYTPKNIISRKVKDLALSGMTLVKAIPQYFNGVQVIEYRNNEEKQGDFEQAITLIDALNVLQSDRISDKEAFIDALLIIYGFTLEGSVKDGLIEAPGKGEDGADAEWLTKTFDESQVQILSKSIEDSIHKVTYVPNMNDENFAGNISGEAMKYKLFGLLQLMSIKSRYMTKGLRQRLQLVASMLNIKGGNVDISGAKIKIKPNLPINTSDIIDQIVKAIDILPLETLLSWLPDIDDPGEEIKKLIEQKKQNIELANKMGGQGASHDNLDDEPEEDEDEVSED